MDIGNYNLLSACTSPAPIQLLLLSGYEWQPIAVTMEARASAERHANYLLKVTSLLEDRYTNLLMSEVRDSLCLSVRSPDTVATLVFSMKT